MDGIVRMMKWRCGFEVGLFVRVELIGSEIKLSHSPHEPSIKSLVSPIRAMKLILYDHDRHHNHEMP
jgi:hypothetical protein